MPKLTTPTNYLKNITKSVIYSAVDVSKGYAEETIDFAESNKEVFIQTYAALKNPKAAIKRSINAIQNSKAFQALDYGVRNVSEDLLSGKFYNKERIERDTGKFTIGGTDDWDDLSDFMDDQDKSSTSNKEPNSEVTAGDLKIVDSIEGSNSALAASTTKAVMTSTDVVVKNNRSNMAMLYTQNERLFGRINDNMSIMHRTMGSIQTILTQSLGNLDKNTSAFFTESLKYQKENNAMLKEMLEMQRNVYKSAESKEKESTSKRKPKIRFSDIAMNGMPDLQKYGENIKKNIKNQMSVLGLPDFGEDSNFLAELMVSPLQYVTEYVVKGLIPITLKESIKELNDSLTGVFGTLMGRLANADDGPLSFIAKILGVNNGINRRIDASKYEKGPIPFDGITRKAIIDVIPSHLRKIEAAVTRQSERIYDYNSGRWTDAISAKKDYENIRKNAVRSGTSNMASSMDREMKMILANATGQDKTDLEKAFEEFREYMYDNRGIFDPRKSASQNNVNYSNYPNFSKHYSKIVTAYKRHAQRYDMKGNQVTDYSKYLTPARDIMLARDNEERQYRLLEESNNAIKVLVSEGANNFNKVGGKLHYSNDKAKSYWEAANPYKQLKDNKGNSIFDYLYKITAELMQIRATGLPGGGGSNILGSGQTHSLTPAEIEAAIKKEGYTDPIANLNSHTAPATEKDLEKALVRIASGEALDLRDFDENEQKALAAYSKAVMVHNTSKYSQNIKNQMEDNAIANFMGKNVYKYNVMTLNDIREINKKANEQNVSTDEVDTNDKEEGKFIKRIKDAVSKYGNIPSAVIGGSVEAFNKVLYSADRAIYEMMYKTELKNTEDKKKYEGFMDFLVGKTEDTFKSLKDGINKNLIDPIRERLGIDDQWQDRFKDSLSNGFMAIANEFINANKSVYGPIYNKAMVKEKTKQARQTMAGKGWQKGLTKTGEIGWIQRNDALATKELRDIRNRTLTDQSQAYLDRNYRKYFSMSENELVNIAIANGTNPESIDAMRMHSLGDSGEFNNDVFKNNLIKNILRHERSLHAKGTFSSPFMGRTMLSKGELLFGVGKDGAPSLANGIREIKETGAYNILQPTHILNPKSAIGKQQDLGREKIMAEKLGLNIASNAPGTLKISSDHDITAKEFLQQAKMYSAEGAAGGVLGGALGLLIPGGPVLGAAIGAGVNIIRSSETLKSKLLGGLDGDGNRKGGIISKTIQDTVKKYLPDMTKYGLAGLIPGLLTPLGPIGGLLVGGTIGYLKNNERFTNKYFGENGKLTIGTKEKDILDKLIPGAVKGGIAGAGVSLVLGGPFGLIGNALIGSAIGMATTTDDWKDAILGTDINGIREGGLVGVFKDAFKPIIEGLDNVKSKIEATIEDSIINPLQRFIKPAIHAVPKLLGAVPRLFVDWLDKRTEKIRETIGTKITKFISPIAGLGKKILSPIASIATMPIKAVGGLVGMAGDRARAYNIRHGDMVDMTQREAVEWMRSHGRENEISDELNFSSNLTDAAGTRRLANSLNQLLDTRESAKANFNKQVKSLNDILTGYEDSEGHRLSNMQISKVIEAAKKGNVSAVGEILRNYKLQGSRNGLTEAEFNSLMEENGLKKAISGVKEAEYRKNNILSSDEETNRVKSELMQKFSEAGLDIDLNDLTNVKNRKKINNLAKLLSDQAIHLEANPDEANSSTELQTEANTHLTGIQESINNIIRLMTARLTGNDEDIKKVIDSTNDRLDIGQKYSNQKFEDVANRKLAQAGINPEDLSNQAFDTLTAKGASTKNVSVDSLNAIARAGAKNTKKIAKINNNVEKQLDSVAIEELYKLNDEESKRVIDRLNNREVSNVIIKGNYPVDKNTIHFLAKPITGTFRTFVSRCKFINKGQCWSEFKSLEEIAEAGLDKFADLRDKYNVDYATFASIYNETKSFIKGGVIDTATAAGKMAVGLASAPFKVIGKTNSVINNLTHNIHGNDYYASRIRPDEDIDAEPAVSQNGIGTFILGSLGKLAGGLFNSAKDKAKSALMSRLPFIGNNSESPDRGLGGTSGSVENEMSDDGKTTVMTEDGPAVIRNGSDGSPEYDTTDPKTKLLLRAKEIKAKATEKLQSAQQKMTDKFNQMFDEAEDANKNSKLGNLLGLLFGGALLLKSGILGKIWENHVHPWITDKALPWVNDKLESAGNWVINTALPAVGKLIGKGISLLVTALPTIIINAIRGAKNLAGGILDGITGNKTNVGANTTIDATTSTGAVFTDSNGNTVTLEEAMQNSANNPNYQFYNQQGATGTINEDGTVTFSDESKKGSSYAKSILSPIAHAFVQGGRHLGGIRLANSAFKGLAKSKGKGLFSLAKRGVGLAGQALTSPIEAIGKASNKFWDGANSAAVNRVRKALGDEVIEGSSETALKNITEKLGNNRIVNFIKNADESLDLGLNILANKNNKNIANATNKSGIFKDLFEYGKDKLKTGVKETADSVIKKAEQAAAKNPDGLVSRILNKTKNAGESKGLAKLLDALKQGLDKLFGDSKIAKKLTQAAELLHISKIAEWVSKLKSSIDNVFDDFLKKAAKKLGSETVEKAASKLNIILTIVMVVTDFLVGCDQAEKILGVSETSVIEELVAGFTNALCNLLILPSIFPGTDAVAQAIMKLFSKDITKRQEDAAKEADEYNKEMGTTLTVEEYLSRNKSVTGKIGGKISDAWNNTKKTVSNTWKSITGGIKSIGSKLFGKGTKQEYYINNPVVNAYGRGSYSKQIDPSVANIPYNIIGDTTRQTIGDSACGPAAAVNVLESFGRGGDAVAKAANFALRGGYKEINGGTKPGFFQDYFAQYGYGSQISHNSKTLESNINNGYPTVLMGSDARGTTSLTPFGKNPHYVTVTGTDGKGHAIVQDPESPYQNQLYSTKTLLNKSSLGISAFGRGKSYRNYIKTVSKYGLGRRRYGRGAVQFNQLVDQVWAFLTTKVGLTENAAAGLMGCWQCESSINPARVEGDYTSEAKTRGIDRILSSRSEMDSWCQWLFSNTDGIHPEGYRVGDHYYCGVGIAQWTAGRTKALFDYAEANGTNVFDLDTQLNFCKSEFDGSYSGVRNAGNAASDLKSATIAMLEGYEAGPGWAARNPDRFNERYSAAQEIFSHYTGKKIEYTGEVLSNGISGISDSSSSSPLSTIGGLIGSLASAVAESRAGKIMSALLGGGDTSSTSTTTSGGNASLAGPMAQRFVQAALGEEGYQETGNNNTKYGEWFGMNNVPWCGEFVSWAADQAGVPTDVIPKTAAAWQGMRPFFRGKNAVIDSTKAQMGDVFTTLGHSHTGIVVDNSNGEIHTIEGNSGDKVAKRTHAPSELEVYRPAWPDAGQATTSSIDTSGFESLEESQKFNDFANTRGSNGIKPLSSYGIFRDTIYGRGTDANSMKTPVRRRIKSKGGYYTIEEFGMDKELNKQQQLAKRKYNYGKGSNNESYYLGTGTLDDSNFNELIKWVITIANNTDQLNTIIKILNDKLGITISATDVANTQGGKTNAQDVVNKAKLSQSGRSKFSQFQDQLENSSIQSVVQAMNAIAAE